VTAATADERSPLPAPTWPPSVSSTSFPLTERRPVVLADDPCEAGFSASDPEYAGIYLHARYFDPKLGTFLSPDPIGVEGGLNQYGYALGNPVNGSDRSGLNMDWGLILCLMGLCQFEQIEVGPGGGGGGVPFELFFDRFAPNPILAQQPGPAQEPAPQEPAQDPPKEEPKQEPTPVPGLVGRPKSKYSGIHNAAMGDAFKRLDGRQCGDFYGGMGPQTMARTEYRFLPLGADVVAATPPPLTPGGPQLRVFVSSDGPFVNPPPMGEVKLPSGTSRFLGSPTAYRSFIYLHELGHQVKSVTGFVEDHDNPRLNSKHSLQVIDACY